MSNDQPLQLWATNAFQSVLKPLAAQVKEAAGEMSVAYRSSNMILAEAAKGGRGDALIATRQALERLARDGVVDAATITDLASVGLGLGVRAGAPRPDVSTPQSVRDVLLAARSIVYSSTGASASYFLDMVQRLGIAAEVRAKAIVYAGGLVGELVAQGEAEIGAQMVSEILAVPGVELAGELPPQFRNPTVFAGAVFAGAKQPVRARALITLLASAAARDAFRAAGMAPPR